jgi:hypothetical protein
VFLRQCLSVVLWLLTSGLRPAPGKVTVVGQQDDAKRSAQEKPAADVQQKASTPVPTAGQVKRPRISSVTVGCPRATTASRLDTDTPISPKILFCENLTVVETKDVEKTRNLGRRLTAVSGAGLVQKDCR